MGILYPGALDTFSVPSLPEDTSLSSAGTSNRNHVESHEDLGRAVMALEANSAQLTHDHSGGGGLFATQKLDQANTHQNPDTDLSAMSIHHTIGPSPTQVAAGNHAHDYAGPSIFNKPFIVCTSQTRPISPFLGQMIFETDTNCYRCWGHFKDNNVVNTGLEYYNLFRSTAGTGIGLDTNLFRTTWVKGSPAGDMLLNLIVLSLVIVPDGAMGVGVQYKGDTGPESLSWVIGLNNVPARVIAQAIGPAQTMSQFTTDDQNIQATQGVITFGTLGQGSSGGKFPSTVDNVPVKGISEVASNDFYLRVSADLQKYVRFSLLSTGVSIAYTIAGPDHEVVLTGAECDTHTPQTEWEFKAVGNTYSIYRDGQVVCTYVDNNNVVTKGADNRGWAIGMAASKGRNCQYGPNNITQITVFDEPAYATQAIWQLLAIGAVPHVRAESRYSQVVHTNNYQAIVPLLVIWLILIVIIIFWIVDWHVSRFMELEVSREIITVQEAGTYAVHASVVWDPAFATFDQSGVAVSVNNEDIGRRNWQYMSGLSRAAAVPQSHDIYFTYYFAVGDQVRVHVGNNSQHETRTYYNPTPGAIQTCFVELNFLGPT